MRVDDADVDKPSKHACQLACCPNYGFRWYATKAAICKNPKFSSRRAACCAAQANSLGIEAQGLVIPNPGFCSLNCQFGKTSD